MQNISYVSILLNKPFCTCVCITKRKRNQNKALSVNVALPHTHAHKSPSTGDFRPVCLASFCQAESVKISS